MIDNATLTIKKQNETVTYSGVICSSIEEASPLIHPDYWSEIPIGMMRIFNDGKKLIRYSENTFLIRVNGSRHFVQIAN